MSTPIRLDDATFETLNRLEKETGLSKKSIIKRALDKYQRDKTIDDLIAYYDALRADPELWEEELAEREIWERASNDGLKDL